ncbi:MAG: hypothetical protein AAFX08_09185 [Pseudomonadota bacterium]
MSTTDAGLRLAGLFARKGQAAPAAAHPLSTEQAAHASRSDEPPRIDWRDVIANARVLDLPAREEHDLAGQLDAAPAAAAPLEPRTERPPRPIAPPRVSAAPCVVPIRKASPARAEEPLAYKTVVRVTARQRRLLRIASAALDVPQQALLRDAVDEFLQKLKATRLNGCKCFSEQFDQRADRTPDERS